jgi:hypothetical protein
MRILHKCWIACLPALSAVLAACPRAVGPQVPGTTWTGGLNAPLENLQACIAGSGFRMRDTWMEGFAWITVETTTPRVIRITSRSFNMSFTSQVSTYLVDFECPASRPSVLMRGTFNPTYVGQMSLTANCIATSRLTFNSFTVLRSPPLWGTFIEGFVRERLHMRLDDWAWAAAQVSPGTTPARLPAEVGRGRCGDWREL